MSAWRCGPGIPPSYRKAIAGAGSLEAQEELRQSRARVVAATDRERRRIERDLHDGAQQRLISIGIGLAAATAQLRTDPDRATTELTELRRQLHLAHDEVRSLAQGVYPPVLSEHGLVEALRSAVDRYPLPLTLDLHDAGLYAGGLIMVALGLLLFFGRFYVLRIYLNRLFEWFGLDPVF